MERNEASRGLADLLANLKFVGSRGSPPEYGFEWNGRGNGVWIPLHRVKVKQEVNAIMSESWGIAPLSDVSTHQWKAIIGEWVKPKQYLLYNDKGKVSGVDIEAVVDDLMDMFHFAAFPGSSQDDLLVYKNGVYAYDGVAVVRSQLEAMVGPPHLTNHIVNEVVGHLSRASYADRFRFNNDRHVLNLRNGLLDLRTMQLRPHSPSFLSTIQLPVEFDPFARCPNINRFLREVLHAGDIPLIYELFGYSLVPDNSMQQAFMFTGDGSNGKSTLINILIGLLGQDNCSSISLQQLEESDFAVAALYGKLLNVVADLPSRTAEGDRAMFKKLTGGDIITAEKKFRDPFTFINYATLVFSTQRPPRTTDDSHAFWRRWIMVNFPNKFEGEEMDRTLSETLTSPEELSGLLNHAIDGLRRLRRQFRFSYRLTVDDVAEAWTLASDPVKAFVYEHCLRGPECEVTRSELYQAYSQFCYDKNMQLIGEAQFGKSLKNVPGLSISDRKHRQNGREIRYYVGLKLRPESLYLLV